MVEIQLEEPEQEQPKPVRKSAKQKEMEDLRTTVESLRSLVVTMDAQLKAAHAMRQPQALESAGAGRGLWENQEDSNAPALQVSNIEMRRLHEVQPHVINQASVSSNPTRTEAVAQAGSSLASKSPPIQYRRKWLFFKQPVVQHKATLTNPRNNEVILSVWENLDIRQCPECFDGVIKTKVEREGDVNRQYIKCKNPRCLYQRVIADAI